MALVTVKLSKDTRHILRIIAAHRGETMHQVAADAAWREMMNAGLLAEYKKSQRQQAKTTARNGKKERK